MDDFRKLQRARQGDRKAWSYLYIKYYDRILHQADALAETVADDAEPEDLLQKYWLHSIQGDSAAPAAAGGAFADDAFEKWLARDFQGWCKGHAAGLENDPFLPLHGLKARASGVL